MEHACQGDKYYELEKIFQQETDKYLVSLRELESVLRSRKTDFARDLYRRVDFLITALETQLFRTESRKRSG